MNREKKNAAPCARCRTAASSKPPRRTPKTLLPKVTSLGELYTFAARDDRYAHLLVVAAENLGGPDFTKLHFPISPKQQEIARRWLDANANETTERGVVAEVNHCRDLVPNNTDRKEAK